MTHVAGALRLKVHGLDCAEEVASLRREVGPVVGGEDRLSFDVLGGTMTVDDIEYAPERISERVKELLEQAASMWGLEIVSFEMKSEAH